MTRDEQRTWLAQVQEPILDPSREIVDPHHHLWRTSALPTYLLDDLFEDTGSGHNVRRTVFIECGAEYRSQGPEHLRPVGETEFVAEAAARSRGSGKLEIAAIVAHADLSQDPGRLREVLAEHEAAGQGLFRGIRDAGAHNPDPAGRWLNATDDPELYARPAFRRGVALLGELGYTFDTWHYHIQNRAFAELARAVPDTQLVLDHFGTPLGVGRFAGRADEVFAEWSRDIAEIAAAENVVAKLGGLAMPPNGFGWDERATPATSDELVAAQSRYYLRAIEVFGADRCMFESNFPVDKLSLSYHVYWNAMKKIASALSTAEQEALFKGTATRVYRLE